MTTTKLELQNNIFSYFIDYILPNPITIFNITIKYIFFYKYITTKYMGSIINLFNILNTATNLSIHKIYAKLWIKF
jgi:hypothetical protein